MQVRHYEIQTARAQWDRRFCDAELRPKIYDAPWHHLLTADVSTNVRHAQTMELGLFVVPLQPSGTNCHTVFDALHRSPSAGGDLKHTISLSTNSFSCLRMYNAPPIQYYNWLCIIIRKLRNNNNNNNTKEGRHFTQTWSWRPQRRTMSRLLQDALVN